jgi:hypothetical protein
MLLLTVHIPPAMRPPPRGLTRVDATNMTLSLLVTTEATVDKLDTPKSNAKAVNLFTRM